MFWNLRSTEPCERLVRCCTSSFSRSFNVRLLGDVRAKHPEVARDHVVDLSGGPGRAALLGHGARLLERSRSPSPSPSPSSVRPVNHFDHETRRAGPFQSATAPVSGFSRAGVARSIELERRSAKRCSADHEPKGQGGHKVNDV